MSTYLTEAHAAFRGLIAGAVLCFATACAGAEIRGNLVKLVDGCEVDFDSNGQPDLALLLESADEVTLVALLRKNGGFENHLLFKAKPQQLGLRCEFGRELVETLSGRGSGKKVTVDGNYMVLYQEESSSVAFYWSAEKFLELWLSD